MAFMNVATVPTEMIPSRSIARFDESHDGIDLLSA
jgi:hypothetical protein